MHKYYLLALFNGIVHKLYDDLYDNNLYEYFNIKLEHKGYVNELLKCLFGISFTILSLKYPFFLIIFIILNVILYFLDKSAYGAYELSGLISSFIIIPFVDFSFDNKIYDYLLIIIMMISYYIIEKLFFINIEYSSKKLYIRTLISIVLTCILLLNNYYNTFSNNIIICLLFALGYMITSCIFQIILLNKNKDKNNDKNNYSNKIIV